MHISALNFGKLFFETYCGAMEGAVVHDIGAQDVNGSLRDVCPPHLGYVGVDFVEGRGVSIVLDDPYHLPFENNSLDVIVCSSVFEHSQFFWLAFLEMMRVLKPEGLLYLNVPSNGSFHRYPVDCWRFYPDSGSALEAWAQREGYTSRLLESFVGGRSPEGFASGGAWNDFVAVFVKDGAHAPRYEKRMLHGLPDCWNGFDATDGQPVNVDFLSPDHADAAALQATVQRQHEELQRQQQKMQSQHGEAQTYLLEAAAIQNREQRNTFPIEEDLKKQLQKVKVELAQKSSDLTRAFAEQELAAAQLSASREQVAAAQQQLGEMMRSRSWRATAAIRQFGTLARKVRNRGRAVLRSAALFAASRPLSPSAPGPLDRAALEAEAAAIAQAGLFDEAYYKRQYKDMRTAANPLLSYCESGWRQGRNPSEEFHTGYYLEKNPDIRAGNLNPLWHFSVYGAAEGREPAPPRGQRASGALRSVARSVRGQGRALFRSAISGVAERAALNAEVVTIAPTGLFDEAYYRATYEDMRDVKRPLLAYCESGWRLGRNPSTKFDTQYYLDNNPDIRAAGVNPLLHYVTSGANEGRHGLPRHRRKRPAAQVDAECAAIRPTGFFDDGFYLAMYPDIEPVPADPLWHYCEIGWLEGRNPSDRFDTDAYLAANTDIRDGGVNPLWHYAVAGARELRYPDPSAVVRYEDDIEFGRIESDVQFVAMYRSPDWAALFASGSNAHGRALPDVRTGYYDSTDPEVLRRQARLAKRHGLYAFGFIVDAADAGHDSVRTLATWIAHPDIAFHFVAALAVPAEDCTEDLIAILGRALADPRCLRVDGRSMLLVRTHAASAVASLRGRLEAVAGPFLLVAWVPSGESFEHAPLGAEALIQGPKDAQKQDHSSYAVLAARGITDIASSPVGTMPRYPLISVGTDGDAVTAGGMAYRRFHSGQYRRWLDTAIAHLRDHAPLDRRFVFAEAWNDWRTGRVLEAERREGYGRLNETTRSLAGVHGNQPMPKVSVIVANYNHERFLRRRLDSIYAQTYRNFEVLLLDDCSSDGSRALMDSYAQAHPNITRTLYNETNSGSAFRQWAKGIQAVTGDLVWIAESDDYCDEHFLEVLVRCFDDEAVMLAGARCEFVNSDETPLQGEFTRYVSDLSCAAQWEGPYVETAHNEVRNALGIKNTIPNASGVVFRRPVDMPLLSEDWWLSMRVAGDWVFYLHLIRGGKIAYAPAAINYFRRYQGSTAESTYRKRVFYEEVGIASRTVAALYNVPIDVLEQCRKGYHAFYGAMVGGSDADFDTWYDYESVLRARHDRKPNLMVSTMGFLPGGAEIFPIRLANEFKRQGLSVLLLNTVLRPREDGIRRMLRNDVPVVETSDLAATKALIDAFGVEVLNSHQWLVQKYPALQADVFDELEAHVATLHGMIEHGAAFGIVEDDLRRADEKVSVWAYTADKNLGPFVDAGLFTPGSSRFAKLPNGIQKPSRIQPVPRAQMNIPDDAFVLCCVSRAIPDKGWQETVDAVALARELSSRDIHLVLVGNGPVYDAFRRLDMPAYVHLIGFSQDAAGYYAASDMGIMLTSFKSESFPLTIIDCLFVNRPFIATKVGEIANMLTDGDRVAGALIGLEEWQVPVGDAARVIASFATDADRYQAAQAVVSDVAKRFSIEAVASRYVDLFEQCRLGDAKER